MKPNVNLFVTALILFGVSSCCSTKKTVTPAPTNEPAPAAVEEPAPTPPAYVAPEESAPVVEETVLSGNTADDAIAITLTGENQSIGPFKLTKESPELWLSMDLEAMNSYYFDSELIEGDGTVSALVLGPPDKKVHGGSTPVGEDGKGFSVVYKETMNNSHFLKILLGEGEEWKGKVSYRFTPTEK